MPKDDPARQPNQRARATLWELLLSVSVLAALAVAQPLYDLLASNAEFFVVRGSKWSDVALVVLFASVILPLALAILVAAVYRISESLGRLLGGLILAVLTSFLLWHFLQTRGWESTLWWLTPFLAVTLAFAFGRIQTLRTFIVFLTPGLLLVPLLFLVKPSMRRALDHQDPAATINLTPDSVEGTAPVVFLIFDELSLASLVTPDLDLDERRFPHLSQLASEANWYRQATTVADTTVQAIPAILSGRFPEQDQLPNFSDHPENLFSLLGGDYYIHAVEAATRLCPSEINRFGQDRGFAVRSIGLMADIGIIWAHLALPPPLRAQLPPISHTWQGFLGGQGALSQITQDDDSKDGFFKMAIREARSGDRFERFDEFLDAIEHGPRDEALYYYHAMLPHRPWEYLANGQPYDGGNRIRGLAKERWYGDQDLVDISLQRYLEQAEMVDGLIGRTVDRLRQAGIYEKALIVVVADHGSAFRSGFSRRVLEEGNASEIAPIPLVIKAPGQTEGRIIDQRVNVLGILPTVARLLEAEPKWPIESRHLPGFFEELDDDFNTDSKRFYGRNLGAIELEDDLFAGVAETARTIEKRLIPGFGDRLFFDSGPKTDLVGQEIASLGPIETFSVKLDLLNHRKYFDRFAPGQGEGELRYLEGQILQRDWEPEPQSLAVVVNGRIVASTWAYPHAKIAFQFSTLLPSTSLRDGFNELRLLRVLPDDASPRFELLEPAQIIARVVPRTDPEKSGLVMNGQHLDYGKSIRGKIMRTQSTGEKISVEGWGVDLQRGTPVDRIIAFAGGEVIGISIPRLPNRWAVEHYGKQDFLVSIFHMPIDRSLVPELTEKGIRIFAISGALASELEASYPAFESDQAWLERGDGRRYRLISPSGPADRSRTVAFLDFQGELRHRPVFMGWAADPEKGMPADQIIVFRDGEYVTQFGMNRRRDDLVQTGAVPPELADAGFAYRGFQGDVEDLHRGRLQFVAVFPDNSAQPLDIRVQPGTVER